MDQQKVTAKVTQATEIVLTMIDYKFQIINETAGYE